MKVTMPALSLVFSPTENTIGDLRPLGPLLGQPLDIGSILSYPYIGGDNYQQSRPLMTKLKL